MSLFEGYVVNQEISTVIKIYPDYVRLFRFVDPFYSRRFDYDEMRPYSGKKTKKIVNQDDIDRKNLNRAKTAVMDIAACNPFTIFATFTFALDRQNVDAKKRQMAFWLNNQRIIHGKFKYIIVPEYHKDGKSIHFHALFWGYKGNLVDSGRVNEHGRKIYNISSYRAGFSTAVIIDDLEKVASYLSKYLTKAMPLFRNKQRYWCSNGLKRPLKIINPLLTLEDSGLFKPIHTCKNQEIFELRGQLPDKVLARLADYGKRRYDDLMAADR